jgi:AcrR family transcriptional regulator
MPERVWTLVLADGRSSGRVEHGFGDFLPRVGWSRTRPPLAFSSMTRERRILDGAAELFYEKGFHGVGVDEIGERVGTSGPALYHYFKGKDEILAALFNEAVEELISGTAPLHDDPQKDLDRLIRHHIDFAIGRRHLVNVYEREEKSLVEPWKRHFRRRERVYAARWEEALRRCYPDAGTADIAAAAQAAIGMIHSVAHWPRESRRSPGLPDLIRRMAINGLDSLKDPGEPEIALVTDPHAAGDPAGDAAGGPGNREPVGVEATTAKPPKRRRTPTRAA